MKIRLASILCALAPAVGALGCAHSQSAARPSAGAAPPVLAAAPGRGGDIDWSTYFGAPGGCFAMLTTPGERWVLSDQTRCRARFRPFSTFKIANALIGLETNAVVDADTVIEWDPAVYPAEDWWPAEWRQTNDLRSAISHSVVPYFRAMAVRIGEEAMRDYIARLGYGNADIGGGVDRFWLTGDLAISAVEQIEFLRALHQGSLPVSKRAQDIVKDILVYERGDGYVLSAKTGTGMLDEGHALGWFVGYVERGDEVHFFALNIPGATFDDIPRQQRIAMTREILTRLGALPAPRE